MLALDKPRIIGGMFGLEVPSVPTGSAPPFITDHSVLLATARSGIMLLIQQLTPGCIWMPSYFCNHILQILQELGPPLNFYELDYDLGMASQEWIDQVKPNDLVIVADYFGFHSDISVKKQLSQQGAWVLEDASQALLSNPVGQYADFVLYSPRKFLGLPDGGLLNSTSGVSLDQLPLATISADWWLQAFQASLLRREFDLHGGDRQWFELFKIVERDGPLTPCAMSEFSKIALCSCFNYPLMAEKRIKNYQQLSSALSDLALFPCLPDGVVPLGFPIRVQDRDRVRQALFSQEIYPPVHWAIGGVVPEEFQGSHRLSAEIMTLPCDQRYGLDEMDRIASAVSREVH